MNKICANCNRETLNNSDLCIYCKNIRQETLKEVIKWCKEHSTCMEYHYNKNNEDEIKTCLDIVIDKCLKELECEE